MAGRSSASSGRPAYGVALRGVAEDCPHLWSGEPQPDWPSVQVSHVAGEPTGPSPPGIRWSATMGEHGLTVCGADFDLTVHPASGTATIIAAEPIDHDMVAHPVAALIGAAHCHWQGGAAFHGSVLRFGDDAWCVLGGTTVGKSTVTARFAQRGTEIVSDDTLVLRAGRAFAGPRAIWLRTDAPAGLGLGAGYQRSARNGQRVSVAVPATSLSLPLAGWIVLRLGDKVSSRSFSAVDRLNTLLRFRTPLGADPREVPLLHLAVLPGFEVRHPKRWDQLDATCDRIEAIATASSTSRAAR